MLCKKCGNAIPDDSIVCKFCGTMMDQTQINMRGKTGNNFNAKLMSDRYGVDKNIIYEKKDNGEKKFIGAIVIIIILIILIVLTILFNMR